MATLNQGDIRYVKFDDIDVVDSVVGMWVIQPRSASDLFTVPRLGHDSNFSVGALNKDVTASFYSSTKAESLIQLTIDNFAEHAKNNDGGSVVIVTKHRQGLSNNLTVRRGMKQV